MTSLAMLPATAAAQRGVGEVHLLVVDESGAPVMASGILESEAVDVRRPFATGEDGRAIITALPLGRYRIAVSRHGFAGASVSVELRSALPLEQRMVLRIETVQAAVTVSGESGTLLDTRRTGSIRHVGVSLLQERPAAAPGRSIIELVNTQPGWLLEANGVLHARGSEYQVQYVIDGMPLRDNRSPAFAQSLGLEEFDAVTVRTGGYPAEFGGKLGGVIEVNTVRDTRTGLHGNAVLQVGSFAAGSGYAFAQYGTRRFRAGLSAEAMTTDRYLDPPVRANFTNQGSGRGFAGHVESAWTDSNRTRGYVYERRTTFGVPNEALQQEAGQLQRRSAGEWLAQVTHQHVLDSRVLAQAGAMTRDTNASLDSNEHATPILAAQDRGFRETYVNGSVTVSGSSHEIKAGGEGVFMSVREQFASSITDRMPGGVELFDDEVPDAFEFSGRRRGREFAVFVQDTMRFGPATVAGGVRYDRYRLMVEEQAVSPRLSASWLVASLPLVLHASYDRTFEPQPVENIILASSELVDELGGNGASRPLRPSRGHFGEVGGSLTIGDRLRLQGTYFLRHSHSATDDELLLNTAISFPIAFASAHVSGFEAALDVPSWGRFSGSASYSLSKGTGSLPLTGGLFLGDDANLISSTEEFPLTQDQRHTVRGRLRGDLGAGAWIAGIVRFDSGLPVEVDGEIDEELLARLYGDDVTGRVDFEAGRVKPSLSVDLSAGMRLVGDSARGVRLQADIINLLDRLNVINFAGLFSGTAIAPGRSFAIRVQAGF